MKAGDWTWLEVTKVVLGLLTPIAVLYLTFSAQGVVRDRESTQLRQERVQSLAEDVYSRRVRAELLASALRRHFAEPADESLAEVVERKRAYDEAYAAWNRASQSNLLSIRQLLAADAYSNLESVVESRLVRQGFAPLDTCLTHAYDQAIRGRNAAALLERCDVRRLLQFTLDCGYAITDELYRATELDAAKRAEAAFSSGQIARRCDIEASGAGGDLPDLE